MSSRDDGIVIGHLGLNVPDLAAAKRYYDQLMPAVDFQAFLEADDQVAYRPGGGKPGTLLFLYPSAEEADWWPRSVHRC